MRGGPTFEITPGRQQKLGCHSARDWTQGQEPNILGWLAVSRALHVG